MKLFKRVLLGLLIVAALLVLGFVVWAETPLGPAPEALSALESDSQVTVTMDDFIIFQPATLQPTTGFIFYPGGRVDYRSYAAPLRAIAEQGYFVVLVPVRLNLAFFDIDAADSVFALYPEIQYWAAGGHSLGGVASALFAKDHPEITGLIFWASYPPDDSLKNSGLKMLSIYGTNDMAGTAKFDETKALLSADARYVIIDGGNHGQFGDYGAQPGDKEATVSRADQQAQAVSATSEFLDELAK
ncbi:MAG TPA: alpha/beta hydrolase [Anaerolineales bacterium]|nr:alpha/beta hydrolase [Anaerolineales bacterium]